MSNNKILNFKKELLRFILAWLFAVLVDLISYFSLLNYFTPNLSKVFSFMAGTFVAYIINKFWTFKKKQKSYLETIKFSLLYTFTMFCNVIINKVSLNYSQFIFLSFIIATGFSTILNFLGQKYWVFKD